MKPMLLAMLLFAGMQVAAQSGWKKVQMQVGVLHRITPVDINRDSIYFKHNTYINRDDQLTSGGLSIGLTYHFSTQYFAQYNQIIRYGYIHGGDLSLYSDPFSEKHKGIMTDLQMTGYRKIITRSENYFLLGVGYSLMNRGTKYNYLQRLPGGGSTTATQNLNFSAANISLGYQFKSKFQLELVNYFVGKTKFHERHPFLLFEGRASYVIAPFKK